MWRVLVLTAPHTVQSQAAHEPQAQQLLDALTHTPANSSTQGAAAAPASTHPAVAALLQSLAAMPRSTATAPTLAALQPLALSGSAAALQHSQVAAGVSNGLPQWLQAAAMQPQLGMPQHRGSSAGQASSAAAAGGATAPMQPGAVPSAQGTAAGGAAGCSPLGTRAPGALSPSLTPSAKRQRIADGFGGSQQAPGSVPAPAPPPARAPAPTAALEATSAMGISPAQAASSGGALGSAAPAPLVPANAPGTNAPAAAGAPAGARCSSAAPVAGVSGGVSVGHDTALTQAQQQYVSHQVQALLSRMGVTPGQAQDALALLLQPPPAH